MAVRNSGESERPRGKAAAWEPSGPGWTKVTRSYTLGGPAATAYERAMGKPHEPRDVTMYVYSSKDTARQANGGAPSVSTQSPVETDTVATIAEPSDDQTIRDRVYALRPLVTGGDAAVKADHEVDLRIRIPVPYEIKDRDSFSAREAVFTDPISGVQFSIYFEQGFQPPRVSRVKDEGFIVEQNGNGQGYTIDTQGVNQPVNLEIEMEVAKVKLGKDSRVIAKGDIGELEAAGENNVVVLGKGAKVLERRADANCTIVDPAGVEPVKPDPVEVAADGVLTEEQKQAAIDRAIKWQEAESERQRIVSEQYYSDEGIYLWQDIDADKLRKGWKTNIVNDVTEEGQRTVTLQGPELALLAVKAGTKVHAKEVSLINRVNVVDGVLSAKRVQQLFVQGTEERESTARISVAVDEVKVAANASVLINRLLKEGYVSADGNLVVRHLDGKVVAKGEEGHEANVVVTEPRDDNFVDLRGDARLFMQTGYFTVSGERNFINDQLVGPGSYVITDGKIQPQNQIREGGQVMQEVVPLPGLILKQSSGKVLPLAEVMPPVLKEKEDEMVALKGRLVKLTGEEILSSLSIPDHVGVDASGIPGIEYVHVQTGGSLHRAKHIDQGIIEGWLTGVDSAGSLEIVGGRAKVGALRGDTVVSEGSELIVGKLYGSVVAEGSKEKPTYVSINNMRGEGVVVLKGTLNTRIEEGYVVVVGNDVTTYGLSGQVRRKTIAPGIYEVHKGEFVPVEEPTKLAEIREKTARYVGDNVPGEVVGDDTEVDRVASDLLASRLAGLSERDRTLIEATLRAREAARNGQGSVVFETATVPAGTRAGDPADRLVQALAKMAEQRGTSDVAASGAIAGEPLSQGHASLVEQTGEPHTVAVATGDDRTDTGIGREVVTVASAELAPVFEFDISQLDPYDWGEAHMMGYPGGFTPRIVRRMPLAPPFEQWGPNDLNPRRR